MPLTGASRPDDRATRPAFHRLVVQDIRPETAEAVSIAFHVPDDLAEAFRFQPGQYLTLRTELGGAECRRCYSICSGLDDGELRIAVKRVESGAFSTYANKALAVGAQLDVMPPAGRFGLPLDAKVAGNYLAIAAGSGITPILSIVKSVLASEPRSRVTLIYGNRTADSILFRDEIEVLKDRHLDRFAVHHVLSRERQDFSILSGRLDEDRVRGLVSAVLAPESVTAVFLCGPAEMMEGAQMALLAIGVPGDRIRMERFVDDSALQMPPGRPRPIGRPDLKEAEEGAPLSVIYEGLVQNVTMQEGETILQAAERHGLDLPYSCRAGMCCTCRAKIVEGAADMAVNYSLEQWEIEAGYVLTCQGRPTSARLVVDFDRA